MGGSCEWCFYIHDEYEIYKKVHILQDPKLQLDIRQIDTPQKAVISKNILTDKKSRCI